MIKIFYTLILFLLIVLNGCGGSSSKKKTTNSNPPNIKEAVFLDSIVAGAKYYSANGVSGYTDKDGVFKYVEGKKVKFWVGDIYLGEAYPVDKPANIKAIKDKIITPFELADAKDKNLTNQKVLKIAQLLIALDKDSNSSNGIEIDLSKLKDSNKSNLKDKSLNTLVETSLIPDINTTKKHLINSLNLKESLNSSKVSNKKDTTPPVITLKGSKNIELKKGSIYKDDGATAYDNVDGNITNKIKVTSKLNNAKEGNYNIEYSVVDSAGNKAIAIRFIKVIPQILPLPGKKPPKPIIENLPKSYNKDSLKLKLKGTPKSFVFINNNYFGAINDSGELNIKLNLKGEDGKKSFSIFLKYNNKDSEELNFTIIKDSTAPVIKLNGKKLITITKGSNYKDLGASAKDNIDGDIVVTKQGSVDVNTIGEYNISYSATDSAGNIATVTRVVKVIIPKKSNSTISGKATINISAFNKYSFIPTIVGFNRDKLTFSIQNKPSWAEFNISTGELSGIPRVEGNFSNIVISASDDKNSASLAPFSITVKPAINIAKAYGIATQGTTASSGYSWYYPASNAIDGKSNTFNHTRADKKENWLQIEIPHHTKVAKIRVLNRQDAKQSRLNGAKVYLTNSQYNENLDESKVVATLSSQKEWQDINISKPIDASYIIIKLPNNENLHIAEVEVYGELPDKPSIKDKAVYVISSSALAKLYSVEAIDYQGEMLNYAIDNSDFKISKRGVISPAKALKSGLYRAKVTVTDEHNNSDSRDINILVSANLASSYGKATISRYYWDNEDGNKTKSSYPELTDEKITNSVYIKHATKNTWAQIALPQDTKVYAVSIFTGGYQGQLNRRKVYLLDKPYSDSSEVNSSKLIGVLKPQKENIILLDKPINGKYLLVKDDYTNSWFAISEIKIYGEVLKQEPIIKNSTNNITIKGADDGDVLIKIDAIDYQGDNLTYSINADVPFSIDEKGNIRVDGALEVKSYEFDVVVSDGEHSTTYHLTINSQTNTKDLLNARDSFEKKAEAFKNTSSVDELVKSFLNYAHQKAKINYENFMQEPLDDSVWNFIEDDEYIKEGLYASRFPVNPFVVKNLADFKTKFDADTFAKYKNLFLGLAVNAKERGIEQTPVFGDTNEHKTIDYLKLSQYQEKERVWKEENSIKNLGFGISRSSFANYLYLKYNLSSSEKDSLVSATNIYKKMRDAGEDIANATYEIRKEYGLSFDEQNLYRVVRGMQRVDCNGADEPCSKIQAFIDNNGTISKTQFLVNFAKLKKEAGLINARNNMANELRELLGVAPNKYNLMSFEELAKWKISLDNIPAKDFGDKEPNWPLFNSSLKYKDNNDYPWQIIALEQDAQKRECEYVKSRFFETDKAKLRDSYPPNAIDGGAKAERRFIKYTTYTWAYNKPEVWYRESEWSPNRTVYRILQDGGVCGRQSTMGQHVNECLNRPSIGIGQPGHRAWVGVYNLNNNPRQYYISIGYQVGSYETGSSGIDTIYDRYTKGIRDRGLERFAGVVTGTSPANVGERVYNKSMILQHIGKILENEGKNPEAVLRKAIEIAPTNADAWYQLALYYAKQDKPQKDIELAYEFMDKKDSIFLDKDNRSYSYSGLNLEYVLGKNIAFTALKAPSVKNGSGSLAEEFKDKLWAYLDKYEKDYRAYLSYAYQNRYLTQLYLVKNQDKESFKDEVKILWERFLANSTSGFYPQKYFEGVNWGDVNKTELFDELATLTDEANIDKSRREKIYKDILHKDITSNLAELTINNICSTSDIKSCHSIKSFELDASEIYITVDKTIGDNQEVEPTQRGKEGYSTLSFPVIDELGNGFTLKVNIAKVTNDGKLLKINDPSSVRSSKTKVIAWIDPNENNVPLNTIYHSEKRVILTVKKRVQNNEEYMGKVVLNVKDLVNTDKSYTFNGKDLIIEYKDLSSVYLVTLNSTIGPTAGFLNTRGETKLNIPVVDDNGNKDILKVKVTNDEYYKMNSARSSGAKNRFIFHFSKLDNPNLKSGMHYKSQYPFAVDAKMWYKNHKIAERFYFNVDMVVPQE